MNDHTARRRLPSWCGAFGFALLSVAGVAWGCSKDTTPAAEPPAAATQPGVETPAAAAAARPVEPQQQAKTAEPGSEGAASGEGLAAASKMSEPNFDLSINPKGAYKAGQAATVEIVLDAKAPFKVNDKYPYKFKVKEGGGVKYPAAVIKEGVKLEKTRAVLSVPFTPESDGKKEIAGRFDFSVCTPERCLIEKRELTLAIDVNK
jgi:hypothetical protein